MLFLLFFDSLPEQTQHLLQFLRPFIACTVIVDVTLLLVLAEPFPELSRQILRRVHVLEILREHSVELVVIRFRLDQDASAQIVEAEKRRTRQPFIQSLHQRHPFIDRNLKAFRSQQVKKF